jgi:hypothetical protein
MYGACEIIEKCSREKFNDAKNLLKNSDELFLFEFFGFFRNFNGNFFMCQ